MDTAESRPLPLSTRFAFWSAAVLSLINVNHFLNMTVGTGRFATLALAVCCTFLCLVVRFPLRRVLGLPGFMLLATLASYLFIGLSVALVTEGIWHSVDPAFPLRMGFATLIVVAAALGAFVTSRRVGVDRLLRGVLVILSITCTLILATPLLLEHIYTLPPRLADRQFQALYRYMGPFTSPTLAGTVCCYTVVLALSFLNNSQRRRYPIVGLLLGTAGGILTLSRTVIVTLGIIFVLFLWFSRPRSRQNQSFVPRRAILIGTGASILLFIGLLNIPHSEYFERLLWSVNIDGPKDVRFQIWPIALSQIAESPAFGHGLMRFHFLEGAPPCRLGLVCGSHNSYLMLWGEAGIIPLLLFLLVIGSLLSTSLTLPQSLATNVVTGWTVVFALACAARDGAPYFPWHSFILGLSCALAMQAKRESQGRRSDPQSTSAPTKP